MGVAAQAATLCRNEVSSRPKVRPSARVIGVEPAGAAKLSTARAAGHPVTLEHSSSIADGLMAIRIGSVPFAHHQAYIDDVVTVSEADIKRGVRLLLDRAKIVAEPAFRKRLNELGGVAPSTGNTPEAFAEVLKRELAVLPKAAQAAGLQLD